MFFAQYGPVGSVKVHLHISSISLYPRLTRYKCRQIMWPRADSVPVGGRRLLGGFVAFLRRPDAEKAAKELDGAEWGGSILRTGWGKAVPLPARPIYGKLESALLCDEKLTLAPPQRSRVLLPAPTETGNVDHVTVVLRLATALVATLPPHHLVRARAHHRGGSGLRWNRGWTTSS